MTTNNQFKSLNAAKAAIKRAALASDYDIIRDRKSGREFQNGYFYVVFYCDGYEEAEDDRQYIRSKGFRAQRKPSAMLDWKEEVVLSKRQKED